MEWLASILNGANGNLVLLFVILILLGLYWAIKQGRISFSGKGLTVGQTRDSELRIVREQLQYMERIIDGAFSKVPERLRKEDDKSYYQAKYWFSLLKDFMETTIIYNHLVKEATYIKLKQEAAYNLMLSSTNDDEYWKSPEFRGLIYNTIDSLITDLVEVRNTYTTKIK